MGAGRPVSVRVAVYRAVKAAREADRIRPEHEPYAALARNVSTALDKPDLSTSDLTRLSSQLTALLSRLPLGEEKPSDRPDPPAAGAGEAGPYPAGLAAGVGTPPEMGDTALPR